MLLSICASTGEGPAVRLRVEVSDGHAQLSEHALIDASRLPARLVARQWGEDP